LLVLIPPDGVLTDIKTFEQHRVYGFAITTANTIQTENQFLSIQWTDIAFIAFYRRTKNYPIKGENWYCSSLAYLQEIVLALKGFRQKQGLGHRSKIKYRIRLSQYRKSNRFSKILKNIDLITPNYHEIYNYLQQKLMLKTPKCYQHIVLFY
jgi:hydroxymethylpyrimidine/phosphomethylpyrimidine kinase